MKKLCFLVNNFDVGGLEKVVISLINNLDRNKFDIFLVCLSGKGKLFDQLDILKENVLILNKKKGFDASLIKEIRKFIIKNRIDIIHAHNFGPLIYSGLAKQLVFFNKPVLFYSEHNQIYRQILLGKWKTKLYLGMADQIITVSNKLKEFYREEMGLTKNVSTIYNGIVKIDPETTALDKASISVDDDAFVVGTAVVLSKQKGISYLIDAAEKVKKKIGNKIQFVIAGDGDLRGELEETANNKELDDIVKFIGYRSDVHNLIQTYDVYILSSLWEGLPLALLEALSAGKPIIATNVGGNPEVVENGINGIIVEPSNSQQLADAIIDLYNKKETLDTYSQINQTKFDDVFSLQPMISNHEKHYLLNT